MNGKFSMGNGFSYDGNVVPYKDFHMVTWWSPDKEVCNQVDHMLVDRRHCTNVGDVRNMRGAETESDHFLVRAKIILKIKGSEMIKKSEIKKWDIGKWNKKEIKEEFKDVTGNVQNTQLEGVADINEIWNRIKKGLSEATGKIIGKEERPQKNSWFDEDVK